MVQHRFIPREMPRVEGRQDGKIQTESFSTEMRDAQAELKDHMSAMAEIAELRIQLENMTEEADPGVRDQLEGKLREMAKMRTEKRQAADRLRQTIRENEKRMKNITAFGDITFDDRIIIERLQEENRTLEMMAADKGTEAEPFTRGSLYKENDFVDVARSQRDAQGKPTGEAKLQSGWVVVDASDPDRIVVQGLEKEQAPDGGEAFPNKIVSAASLEQWNSV